MDAVERYRQRRKNRLHKRMMETDDVAERAKLAIILYKTCYLPFRKVKEDGGPGSGNWGHEGRPGERGGSKKGTGGVANRMGGKLSGYLSKSKERKKSGGNLGVVQGKDISSTFTWDKDKYENEIDAVLAAQGFNGNPKILSGKEFDDAVQKGITLVDPITGEEKSSKFIAARAYSGLEEELEGYEFGLREGEFYVSCEVGGSQYGQGMYCAGDYTGGENIDSIFAETDHYGELNEGRTSSRYGINKLQDEALKEYEASGHERPQAPARPEAPAVPSETLSNEDKVEYARNVAETTDDEMTKAVCAYYEYQQSSIASIDSDLVNRAIQASKYIATDAVAANQKITELEQGVSEYGKKKYEKDVAEYGSKVEEYNKEMEQYNKEYSEYRKQSKEYSDKACDASHVPKTATKVETLTLDSSARVVSYSQIHNMMKDEHIAEDDVGVYAALKGYDAINAEGHGLSASYTVVLNRTKLILKGN